MTTTQHQPAASAIGPRLSIMMFLQFFIWGAWYVSITGWMNKMGIDGLTGWVYTVGPIAAIVSPFILGMIADRFFATQRIMGVMHLVGGIALCLIPSVIHAWHPEKPASSPDYFFHPLVLLLLLHMLCYMPTLGLTNSLSFTHMTNPEKQFPWVRVWGTAGWIVANIVVGGNLKTFGLDVSWIAEGDRSQLQLYIAGGAGLLLGLYSFTLPHTPPPAAGKKFSARQALGLDALRLMRFPAFTVFVICSFLICIPLAAYYQQGRNFVEFAGFKNAPLTMSAGQFSELFFMAAMPLFFARLGVKWMLAVGMAAWVLRYGLFSTAAVSNVKWMIFLGVLLHGICYDFFFVTGFIYVDRKAPVEIRGQAQGLLVLITQGLGLGVGADVIIRLAKHFKAVSEPALAWKSLWLTAGLAAAVILVIFVLAFKDDSQPHSVDKK